MLFGFPYKRNRPKSDLSKMGGARGWNPKKGPTTVSRPLVQDELTRIGKMWGIMRNTAKRVEAAYEDLDYPLMRQHAEIARSLMQDSVDALPRLAQSVDQKGYDGVLADIVRAAAQIPDKALWREARIEELALMALPALRGKPVETELMSLVLGFTFVSAETAEQLEKRLGEMGDAGQLMMEVASFERQTTRIRLEKLEAIEQNELMVHIFLQTPI